MGTQWSEAKKRYRSYQLSHIKKQIMSASALVCLAIISGAPYWMAWVFNYMQQYPADSIQLYGSRSSGEIRFGMLRVAFTASISMRKVTASYIFFTILLTLVAFMGGIPVPGELEELEVRALFVTLYTDVRMTVVVLMIVAYIWVLVKKESIVEWTRRNAFLCGGAFLIASRPKLYDFIMPVILDLFMIK